MNWELVVAIFAAVFSSTGFWTVVLNWNKHKKAETRLLLGLAYPQIVQHCETFNKQGYFTAREYNDLNKYLYEPYKELGGDGTAKDMMEKVKALPMRQKGEKHAEE